MSWEDDARCRRYDPELFFVPRVGSERKAKAVCSRCPVRTDCLAFALESRSEFGVWGGMTSRERRSLLRRSSGQGGWRQVLEAADIAG